MRVGFHKEGWAPHLLKGIPYYKDHGDICRSGGGVGSSWLCVKIRQIQSDDSYFHHSAQTGCWPPLGESINQGLEPLLFPFQTLRSTEVWSFWMVREAPVSHLLGKTEADPPHPDLKNNQLQSR